MAIVDFHSHILPGIDDGSRDLSMTTKMLQMASDQNIDIMVATPHFYSDSMSIEGFLRHRDRARDSVEGVAAEYGIRLVSAAEVAFFPRMSASKELEYLCLEGTNLILIEMPFRPWTGHDLRELELLMQDGYQPIIAHLERFPKLQNDKNIIPELLNMPVYVQINAGALLKFGTRNYAISLFRDGKAQLLGSDCHNLTDRKQNLEAARGVIEKKLGRSKLRRMDRLATKMTMDNVEL